MIAAHCVTPRLLVNELRHMGKWRLNAGRSPHVEKKDIRENDCHSVEMGYNAGITCRMDTHAHTVDCQANRRQHHTPLVSALACIFQHTGQQPHIREPLLRGFLLLLMRLP